MANEMVMEQQSVNQGIERQQALDKILEDIQEAQLDKDFVGAMNRVKDTTSAIKAAINGNVGIGISGEGKNGNLGKSGPS